MKHKLSYFFSTPDLYSGRSFIVRRGAKTTLSVSFLSVLSQEVRSINSSTLARRAGFFFRAQWLVKTGTFPAPRLTRTTNKTHRLVINNAKTFILFYTFVHKGNERSNQST